METCLRSFKNGKSRSYDLLIYSFLITGGLGSYTPSKMADTPFQLGVTRTVPHASSNKQTNNDNTKLPNINGNNAMETEEVLRPTEDAISWSGGSSSPVMLF